MKPILWLGSSGEEIRRFPDGARRDAGFELYQVQLGLEPADWRPMSTVAPGVREIRIHDRKECRILYVARFAEAIYVLHAFIKKTQHTARSDIEPTRIRFRQLMEARRRKP